MSGIILLIGAFAAIVFTSVMARNAWGLFAFIAIWSVGSIFTLFIPFGSLATLVVLVPVYGVAQKAHLKSVLNSLDDEERDLEQVFD